MARYHYGQFLVNQEGQPINNASISVYLAGTFIPAFVYKSEFGSDGTDTAPQVYTNKTGYFEFGLGDDSDVQGYPIGYKFKIQGEREGIASGSIDGIDIFPGFAPVDEDDDSSTIKNKLISNYLAFHGQEHIQHQDVTTTAKPTFEQVRLTQSPYEDDDITTKQYVDGRIEGLSGNNPVISFYNPSTELPSNNTVGDRYIANASGNGGTENYIYEGTDYEGGQGIEIIPITGYSVLVEEEERHYTYNEDLNGGTWVKFSAGFAWYIITSNTTLTNRSGYLVDCRSNPITLNFPSNPLTGGRIDILDYTASSETNNITLNANGNNIEGQSEFIIDIGGAGLQFVYTDAEFGGKILNEVYSEDELTKVFEEYHDISNTDSGGTTDNTEEYITITHQRGSQGPNVTVYNSDTNEMITPNQIKSIDIENIRLGFDSALNIMVKLS